jgi:cytoskeletal protein RodZ
VVRVTDEMPIWPQPVEQQQGDEPQRGMKPGVKLAIGGAVLVLMCCGGTALFGVFAKKPDTASAPQFVEPSVAVAPSVGTVEPGVPSAASAAPPTSKVAVTRTSSTKPATKTTSPKEQKPDPEPTTKKPTAAPTTTKPSSPQVQEGIRAGDLCSPRGAIGRTSRGRYAICAPGNDDPRDRWRTQR